MKTKTYCYTQEYRCKDGTISYHQVKVTRPILGRKPHVRLLTDEQIAEAHARNTSGISMRKLAVEYGINVLTLKSYILQWKSEHPSNN
jgi:hypothetical protein